MANPLHLGQGLAIDAGKCRVGTPLHMGHSRNRQARWVHAVHTAGGEQVAFTHVGIGLDEPQLDPAAMLSRRVTISHRSRTRAQVEHGNGLVTVHQQRHFAHQRKDAGDLPDDTGFINDRLPAFDVVLLSFVDDDAAGKGVARGLENATDDAIDIKTAGIPVFAYGNFLTILVNFAILAFVIFMMVKQINRLRAAEPPAPEPEAPVTPEDVLLLREIRDSLKK